MHTGRSYPFLQTVLWTKRYLYWFILIATVPVLLYQLLDWHWISLPWLPISLIGIAVAFYLGFKNNSSYDRLWEARKIWGAIVNDSRAWGIMTLDFVTNEFTENPVAEEELKQTHTRLIYRHIAWLTALRYQLRASRSWEHKLPPRDQISRIYDILEYTEPLPAALALFLSETEKDHVLARKNAATHIIARQSAQLRELKSRGLIDSFRHMEMEKLLVNFYTHQGRCERIKNFPFPRQYATVNLFFVWMFILLLPFGMINVFANPDTVGLDWRIWMAIPFTILVSWVFHTMEMIGDYSENPFEGLHNDIPITALSRTIEIDLREMLGETDLPPAREAVNQILT